MGMDLVPRSGGETIHYNWSGWRALIEFLETRGVDTSEFDGHNDGNPIRAETCRWVAQTIEAYPNDYNAIYGGTPIDQGGYGDNPAPTDAANWRASRGVRQF